MIVNHGVVRETELICPISVHYIYLAVAVTIAGKYNLAVSARRRLVECVE
jgi:hypothetical protein